MTLIAYSPLARGALLEKRFLPLMAELGDVGMRHGKNAMQVALNWLIAKKNVVAIPKAGNAEHAVENAAAADFRLSAADIGRIDAAARRFKRSPLVPLHIGSLLKHTAFWHGAAARGIGNRKEKNAG